MSDTSNRRKFSHNRMLFYSTICASVALSVVSGYETYIGLLDFMVEGVVGHVLSATLTFGIQVLLFVISWIIANNLRDGFRANAKNWAIWSLCGFFSAYFSYYGFLYTTGGRNEDIRIQKITSARNEMLGGIDQRFAAGLEAAHQANLLDSPAYKDWVEQSLRKLMTIAATSETKIAAAARVQREELLQRQKAARDRLAPLEQQRRDMQTALELARLDLQRMQADHAALSQSVADKKAERAAAEADVAAFEANMAQEEKTKRGKLYREAEVKRNSALARVAAVDAVLPKMETDLADLERRKIGQELNAQDNVEERHLNEIVTQIDSVKAEIADIDAQMESTAQGVQFSFDDQQKRLDVELSNLAARKYEALDALTQQCADVKQRLIGTALRNDVAAIECSSSAVVEIVGNLLTMQAARTKFAESCLDPANAVAFARPEGSRESLVNPAIDQLAACVAQEPDPAVRADLSAGVDLLKKQRGDDVDPITMASVALFSDLQGNAVMSAVFAVIVDVLVLLCALVGKNVGLSERVRAIDLIIARSRPVPGGSPAYERQLDLEGLDPKQRGLVEEVVGEMLRLDLMDYRDEAGTMLMLKKGALVRLTILRNREANEEDSALPPAQPAVAATLPRRRGFRT